jgi:putative glutathione S-transferase
MIYTEFDALIPEEKRETTKGEAGFLPPSLKTELDTFREWVYHSINDGVYRTGFASTQEAYEFSLFPLFEGLDRVEEHLADPAHQPYLFGENITDADIRLYSTLIRFDVAYFSSFKCNLKMIRYEYPRLHTWLRNLYWDPENKFNGAFRDTVRFDLVSHCCRLEELRKSLTTSQYKQQYAYATVSKVYSKGPIPHILPL